jgi:hypothetical protein
MHINRVSAARFVPMEFELEEDPPITRPEQLDWLQARMRQLNIAELELETDRVEKYIRAAGRRKDFAYCVEILDRLPQDFAKKIIAKNAEWLFHQERAGEHSFALVLLGVSLKKTESIISRILLVMCIARRRAGLGSLDETAAVITLLLQSPFPLTVVQFVLRFSEQDFCALMKALRNANALLQNYSGLPLILYFYVTSFERVFRWVDTTHDLNLLHVLIDYFALPRLGQEVQKTVCEQLHKRDFSFLVRLLGAYSDEARKEIIKSVPSWIGENSPNQTNFVHWLYSSLETDAEAYLHLLIDMLPPVQIVRLWSAYNEAHQHPDELNPQRHIRIRPYLEARLQFLLKDVKETFYERLRSRDFAFLSGLLGLCRDEARKEIIKSVPSWIGENDPNQANFVHWLYGCPFAEAEIYLRLLVDLLPPVQIARLWEAKNESLQQPDQLNRDLANKLNPALQARLGPELELALKRGITIAEVCAFVFFKMNGIVKLPSKDFIEQVVQFSQDSACHEFARYYSEIERGWQCVSRYQPDGYAKDPVQHADLLHLAALFASGSEMLPRVHQLSKHLEVRFGEAFTHCNAHSEEIHQNFCVYKAAVGRVAKAALETALQGLLKKNVALESIQPLLRKKLSRTQLATLILAMKTSLDPQVQRLLPALERKLKFWTDFRDFVANRAQAKEIKTADLNLVIENLQDMSGRDLSRDRVPLAYFVDLLRQFGDLTCKRVGQRYGAIFQATTTTPFEVEAPSPASILCEAYYIETELPVIRSVEDSVLSRAKTHLVHLLQYNPKTRRVYLLSRCDKASYFGSGSFKEATPSLEFNLDDPAYFAPKIRLFTINRQWDDAKSIAEDVEHLHSAEIEIMRHFQRRNGFMGVQSVAEYSFKRLRYDTGLIEDVARVSVIVDPAVKIHTSSAKECYTIREKIMIARELCDALDALHREGVIHGDLKCRNAMILQNRQSQVLMGAVLIDFGFSELCEVGAPIVLRGGSRYNTGIYGSVSMTPPELLGEKNFSKDHFKVESFAMGFLMYSLYYGHDPAWDRIVWSYHKKHCPTEHDQHHAQAKLRRAVKSEIRDMMHQIKPPGGEEYIKIMCSLLQPNPAHRASVGQAAEQLAALLNTLPLPSLPLPVSPPAPRESCVLL